MREWRRRRMDSRRNRTLSQRCLCPMTRLRVTIQERRKVRKLRGGLCPESERLASPAERKSKLTVATDASPLEIGAGYA